MWSRWDLTVKITFEVTCCLKLFVTMETEPIIREINPTVLKIREDRVRSETDDYPRLSNPVHDFAVWSETLIQSVDRSCFHVWQVGINPCWWDETLDNITVPYQTCKNNDQLSKYQERKNIKTFLKISDRTCSSMRSISRPISVFVSTFRASQKWMSRNLNSPSCMPNETVSKKQHLINLGGGANLKQREHREVLIRPCNVRQFA